MGRQTCLFEYATGQRAGLPFVKTFGEGRTHLAKREAVDLGVAPTICGRWEQPVEQMVTQLGVLNAARNLCGHCRKQLSDEEAELLAAIANAQTQKTIEASDIRQPD